jgi:hypothetical protein
MKPFIFSRLRCLAGTHGVFLKPAQELDHLPAEQCMQTQTHASSGSMEREEEGGVPGAGDHGSQETDPAVRRQLAGAASTLPRRPGAGA